MPMTTIRFVGREFNSQGCIEDHEVRRPLGLPSPFTYADAINAAYVAMRYPYPELGQPAYEHIRVISVTFN